MSQLIAICFTAGMALPSVLARAESDTCAMRIPAGDARMTLVSFAEQSGQQIIYDSDAVAGVRTKPVHGTMTPLAALHAMLARTVLTVVVDEHSGAVSVRRKFSVDATKAPEEPEGKRGASSAREPRPTTEPDPMTLKRKKSGLLAFVTALLGLSLAPLHAADAPETSAGFGSIEGRVKNAVSGRYLEGARIVLEGTNVEAFTDQTGSYRMPRVPAGTAILSVFYTGLDRWTKSVVVTPGGSVNQDIGLTNVALYGTRDESVRLDALVVSAARETDVATISINEQRFAPNIKNVVATDSLGDMMDGQVGEFLKFLPGITPIYDAENGGAVSSVSVRGLPTSMTVISADGLEMASSGNPLGNSRVFQFKEVSINNISRLEVTKVPTPANPADSMAGSINMISKSAFERSDAEFRYSASISGLANSLELSKQPYLSGERIHKIRPSFTFDYTLPASPNFGIIVTGQSQQRFIDRHRASITYRTSATGTTAQPSQPYLQQYELRTEPRVNTRQSIALRADWRPHAHGVLSLNLEQSQFNSDKYAASAVFNTGTTGTPSVAGGTSQSFGPDFVIGATGRGGITLMNGGSSLVQKLVAKLASLRYRFDDGTWRIEGAFSASESAGGYRDTSEGRFRTLTTVVSQPVRVTFRDIDTFRPGVVQVFDNKDKELDWRDLSNYQVNSALSTPRPIRDTVVQRVFTKGSGGR